MPASAPRSRLERSAGQSLLQSLLHVLSCDFSPPVLATLHMTNLHMTKISVLATALSLIVLAACKPDAPQPDTAKQPSAATTAPTKRQPAVPASSTKPQAAGPATTARIARPEEGRVGKEGVCTCNSVGAPSQ